MAKQKNDTPKTSDEPKPADEVETFPDDIDDEVLEKAWETVVK